MAKAKVPEIPLSRKELFDVPRISQAHLEEFERHVYELERLKKEYEKRCELPKIDLGAVEYEITEMVLLGCVVEPGPLTVSILPSGKIVVCRNEEEDPLKGEEIPF